jgi:1-acyl-sn-glycerol-3-phosphate acyltransferase
MGSHFYRSMRLVANCTKGLCIREVVLDRERANRVRDGGLVVACTHLSHLEPVFVSGIIRRQVRWMARIEFYRSRWSAALLDRSGAFPIDRVAHPLPAVRSAIRLVDAGHIVGLFPEGGVVQARQSVLGGTPIKQGVCTIAIATGVPVMPIVVLGTEKLNRVGPWLPFRRGRVWIAFGRRAERAEMTARLQEEFVQAYRHLVREAGLRDHYS